MPITQASLLGLPSELRLRIYDFYLEDLTVATPHTQSPLDTSTQQSILHVCRTIRKEVYKPFLQNATFELHHGLTQHNFSAWLDALGAEGVSNLRRLDFGTIGRCTELTDVYDNKDGQESVTYCRRHFSLDLTTPNATEVLDIRGCSPRDICDCSDDVLDPFCSNQSLDCLELNCRARIAAMQQIEWHEGRPVVTKEWLLPLLGTLCQDNEKGLIRPDDENEEEEDEDEEDSEGL